MGNTLFKIADEVVDIEFIRFGFWLDRENPTFYVIVFKDGTQRQFSALNSKKAEDDLLSAIGYDLNDK